MLYVSNKGGGSPVDLETAILDGFASDGGLYVPEKLPLFSLDTLNNWKDLSYQDLALEILTHFIDPKIISKSQLRKIIWKAFDPFVKGVIPIPKLSSRKDIHIMELFHGPTLSFKDIGQSFLIHLFDFFLSRRGEHRTVVVATTGDTGPAAAHFIAGKSTLDGWILYPKGMITEEQERQMTTLAYNNIHPVGVSNCPEGGDDLDAVISKLYANKTFKEKVQLTSVNSINWGRIMMQMVHYFYGYFAITNEVGEEIIMAVPSGGFGNLCAGGFARKMGLPIRHYIVANNKNACLHRIFSQGIISKKPIYETLSSAIDILVPYNFWRYLYFCVDKDSERVRTWIEQFEKFGTVQIDDENFHAIREGFLSASISDETTKNTIRETFQESKYLLDPHAAVALAAVKEWKEKCDGYKVICLATAHPAKFSKTIKDSIQNEQLPFEATHPSIEQARKMCQKGYSIDHSHLEEALLHAMTRNWEQSQGMLKE